jgi:hypothetical protein
MITQIKSGEIILHYFAVWVVFPDQISNSFIEDVRIIASLDDELLDEESSIIKRKNYQQPG